MLQAREFACILLFLASCFLPVNSYAQENEPVNSGREVRRLGDTPVQDEFDLEVTAPQPEVAPTPPPETEAERKAREQRERENSIRQNLALAGKAAREGRWDEPRGDCAWYYYRAVLDLDPGNAEAERGLGRVQQAMVDKATEYARELDFESAERILEKAALVRADQELVERANEEIRNFRAKQAEDLEIAAVRAMDAGEFDNAERALIELVALGDMESIINQLRRRLEEARVYGGFRPGQEIRDQFINKDMWTPESVIVLAGSFIMGSSAFEDGRKDNEGPQHRVTFRRGFAIGRTEVTVAQFRTFVDTTGYHTDAEKQGHTIVYDNYSGRLTERKDLNWEMNYEGRKAEDNDPVVHVSWNDAHSYVRWLSLETGKPYRLPSEAEFEYAVRGGKTTRYWWGDGRPTRTVENLTGEGDVSKGRRQWETYFEDYDDKYWGPAPVASFVPNPFGLYDIGGNVAEWIMDCWHETYLRGPVNGSAWVNPGCKLRVVRGAYWASSPDQARSAFRLSARPDRRDARIGFRIARDL